MNEEIMKKLGFEKEVKLIKQSICPFCVEPVELFEFRDETSRLEHLISGLCQACQDEIFDS